MGEKNLDVFLSGLHVAITMSWECGSLPQSEKTVLSEVTHASSKSQLQRVQTSPRLERTEGIHNNN